MKIFSFILSIFLPLSLAGQIHRGDFTLKKVDADYSMPVQSGMVYPDFSKQANRTYIPVKQCRYIRMSMDHKLTLKERSPRTVLALEKEMNGAHTSGFNDASWLTGVLPFAVNKYPDRYMNGVCYRSRLIIPEEHKKGVLRIFILSANYFADVWVNGAWAGCHEGGYAGFAFDITRHVRFGRENLIVIRLDNVPWITDDNPKANEHTIVPYKQMDWWNTTGIGRDVYIEVSEKISVARADVPYGITDRAECLLKPYVTFHNAFPEKKALAVSVNIYPALVNEKNILSLDARDLCDWDRPVFRGPEAVREIASASYEAVKISPVKLRIASSGAPAEGSIRTWSAADPRLYVLEVVTKEKGRVIDKSYFQFGIRKYSIRDQKIFVNDEKDPLFLKGTAYHEEFYPDGRALPESRLSVILDNFRLVRDLNCNFLRTTHYPQHFFTYLLADRFGLWIWEEIPVMWFDGPEMLFQARNKKLPRQMLLEMMYMNYNSPSILFNGFANECGWQDERREYLWEMKKTARGVMKNRIYGQSASGSDMTDNTHRDMDILGATMYYGVFYWDDPYAHTLLALRKMNAHFPGKPIIATEFGYWSGDDLSAMDRQVSVALQTTKAFIESGKVSGMVWWALLDWYTILTGTQTMGLVTMDRKFIKPVFFELQKLYGRKIKEYSIRFPDLMKGQKVKGLFTLTARISPEEGIRSVRYSASGPDFLPMTLRGKEYQARIDTGKMSEGPSSFLVRLELENGEVLYGQAEVLVDNRDDPPEFQVNMQQGKTLMDSFELTVRASDDGAVAFIEYSVDRGEAVRMKGQEGTYRSRLDFRGMKNGSKHGLRLVVKDNGAHALVTNISFVYDNTPGEKIDLPYDLDRIAGAENMADLYYWGYPAEELPESRSWVVCDGCNSKLFFPDKKDRANNVMVCMGNYVKVKPGNYSVLNIWGYSYWGNQVNDLKAHYTDGSYDVLDLKLSEWTRPEPQFNDHRACFCSEHYESSGKRGLPSTSFFHCKFSINSKKKLKAVEFPNDSHKHVIAAGVEK